MPRNIIKTDEPVVLEGFQAVMKPSKFGYSLSAIVDQAMIDSLSEDRANMVEWAQSKLKNPKRGTLKPEPWIESEETADMFRIKFSWNEENKPPVVDTEGTVLTDEKIPVYSGAKVRLAFYQKPYILKDGETYGTSLKLLGVQVVELKSGAGIDTGDLSTEDVVALFGTSTGFKQAEPNITPAEPVTANDDEFDF
jgi:hypothetical protein